MTEITTVIIPPEKHSFSTIGKHAQELLSPKAPWVFVSLDMIPEEVSQFATKYKKEGKILLVDVTTEIINEKHEKEILPNIDKIYHITNPSHLQNMNHTLRKAIEDAGNKTDLIFNSLTTLLIYNDENTVLQFLHRFLIFLKQKNVDSLLIVIKQERTSEVVKALSTISKLKEMER